MRRQRVGPALAVLAALVVLAGACTNGAKKPSGTGGTDSSSIPATTVAPNADDVAGLSWSRPDRVDSQAILAVSCPRIDFCLATDQVGRSLDFNGESWTVPVAIGSGDVEANGISCVASGFCGAILDQNAYLVTYSGHRWSAPVSPGTSGYDFNAISCATGDFCVAVGDSLGNATVWNGDTWGSLQPADPGGNLSAVSCPKPNFCAAVNLDDDTANPTSAGAVTFDGSRWSTSVAMPDGFGDGQGISCTSSKFCVAIDNAGEASVYNGTRFVSAMPIDTANINTSDGAVPGQTTAVSCVTTKFCVVVDSNGNALTFDGSDWSPPGRIDTGHQLNDVSCASTSFCVAVDQEGFAVAGT